MVLAALVMLPLVGWSATWLICGRASVLRWTAHSGVKLLRLLRYVVGGRAQGDAALAAGGARAGVVRCAAAGAAIPRLTGEAALGAGDEYLRAARRRSAGGEVTTEHAGMRLGVRQGAPSVMSAREGAGEHGHDECVRQGGRGGAGGADVPAHGALRLGPAAWRGRHRGGLPDARLRAAQALRAGASTPDSMERRAVCALHMTPVVLATAVDEAAREGARPGAAAQRQVVLVAGQGLRGYLPAAERGGSCTMAQRRGKCCTPKHSAGMRTWLDGSCASTPCTLLTSRPTDLLASWLLLGRLA
eukprot:scaffold5178_cov364-Prasinococcus_capsulatus_cf.AAC.12